MTGPAGTGQDSQDPQDESPVADAEARRRRRAAVFGDVLPDTTSDERADGADRSTGWESAGDEWLRRQVPPHHG